MADFHQEGIITTLHALYEAFDREAYLRNLEHKLEEYAQHLSICLLLPCLYSELKNPAVVDRIIGEIQKVNYLQCVVVALGGAQEESHFQEAKALFGKLKTPVGKPGLRDIRAIVCHESARIGEAPDAVSARSSNAEIEAVS